VIQIAKRRDNTGGNDVANIWIEKNGVGNHTVS
jgi:hypothetical protein